MPERFRVNALDASSSVRGPVDAEVLFAGGAYLEALRQPGTRVVNPCKHAQAFLDLRQS